MPKKEESVRWLSVVIKVVLDWRLSSRSCWIGDF